MKNKYVFIGTIFFVIFLGLCVKLLDRVIYYERQKNGSVVPYNSPGNTNGNEIPSTPTPTPSDILNATVEVGILGVTVYNNDSVDWKNCNISINAGLLDDGYKDTEDVLIEKGSTGVKNFIPFDQFTKNDGTRFDYDTTAPKTVSIYCNDNGQGNYAGYSIELGK